MKGLWIYDSEGDGLCGKDIPTSEHITKFHCLLFKLYGQNNWVLFLDHSHPEFEEAKKFAENKGVNLEILDFKQGQCFKKWIRREDVKALACQNQYGFDLPAFKYLWDVSYDMFPENLDGEPISLYDTLSMSRTLFPDRPLPAGCPSAVKNPLGGKAKMIGPHSLEAWGYKLANQKVAIEDWRGLPLWKYVDRVWEDVIINELQWQALIQEMKPDEELGIDWKMAMRNNMLTDFLMQSQSEQGVVFDKEAAENLLVTIDTRMDTLASEVEPLLPKRMLPKSQQPTFPKEPFKGDGEISSTGWNWLERQLGYNINREALSFKAPPKASFKGDGELSAAGKNYCIKNGVEDVNLMPDFIRQQRLKEVNLSPLSDEDMVLARNDLNLKKMPDLMVPMKIGDGDDIKEWMIKEGGWKPTLFNTKDATRGERKQTLPDSQVEENIKAYIEKTKESPYKILVYKEMGVNFEEDKPEKVMSVLKKKARFLVTSPKLKDQNGLCPNLAKVKSEEAKKIVTWLSLRNRRSVIKTKDEKKDTGWLNNPRLLQDGKLSARYTGITPTNRRKHTVVANIPSTSALLGAEMRGLFTVPDGYFQLGIDGSNLEGMVAAWQAYEFDQGEYLSRMEGVDNHAIMAEAYSKAAGKEISRNDGKPITYGVLYGCQAAKAAEMLGTSKEIGQQVIDAYWDTNYGLKGRKEWLEEYWEKSGKKFIQGVDGRKIFTRSKHSLLNARLQSGGAIGMDLAGIIFHEKAKAENLLDKGLSRTIYYHDEYQLQVPAEMMRWKRFETGVENKALVNSIIAELKKAKKAKKEGKDYKTNLQLGIEYGLLESDIDNIQTAKEQADKYEVEGFLLSGNTYTFENGDVARNYSRAGVIMVEAIEEAYQQLNCPVKITGEYLCGRTWGDCH